jgi:hypothetical protein
MQAVRPEALRLPEDLFAEGKKMQAPTPLTSAQGSQLTLVLQNAAMSVDKGRFFG